jgi:hypothetical protein
VAVHGHRTLAAQRSPPSLLTSTYVIADRTTLASQLIGDVRSWVALCDTVLPPTRPATLISCPVSMRLLQINGDGDLSLVEYFGSDIPRYAILSHTWGADDDEISFKDVKKNRARSKHGVLTMMKSHSRMSRRTAQGANLPVTTKSAFVENKL